MNPVKVEKLVNFVVGSTVEEAGYFIEQVAREAIEEYEKEIDSFDVYSKHLDYLEEEDYCEYIEETYSLWLLYRKHEAKVYAEFLDRETNGTSCFDDCDTREEGEKLIERIQLRTSTPSYKAVHQDIFDRWVRRFK